MKLLSLSACVCLFLHPAHAAPEKPRDLSPEQEKQLARDKVLITGRTWNQIFTPYIFAGRPVFITSDSALNAWHVLLEESFATLEDRTALRMPRTLEAVLQHLQEHPEDLPAEIKDKALRRALVVLGTAARLAGSQWSGGPEVDALVGEQTGAVEKAEAVAMPSWLAPGFGVAAIDYRVFKPVGFYTRTERLRRYFRALRWLQTIPFRARMDEEMAAMVLITAAVQAESSLSQLSAIQRSLGGKAADHDAVSVLAYSSQPSQEAIDRWRAGKSEMDRMVILSATAVPDAGVFQKTTGPARPWPNSLEIAAWLGSSLAENLVRKSAGDPVIKEIAAQREVFENENTLYLHYLHSARKLFAPPEPDAPAFMKSLPWQRKSLNTALCGWAQLRHAWALQAKEDALCLPAGRPYPGFVEPNPAFFGALCELILRCINEFDAHGALDVSFDSLPADAAALIPRLEAEAAGLRNRLEPFQKKLTSGATFTNDEQSKLDEAKKLPDDIHEALKPFVHIVDGISCFIPGANVTGIHDPDRVLEGLRQVAAGRKTDDILRARRYWGGRSLRHRWLQLLSVCRKLESNAHRQLRGVEPSGADAGFIVDYGEILGGIMFYDGNSYHAPRDDAPRVATVFSHPGAQCLLAGTGRPREIHIRYPWKGQEINCRGAILTFHEWQADQRMTDTEWLSLLDSPSAPADPAWLSPLVAPAGKARKPGE